MYLQCLLFSISCLKSWPLNVGHKLLLCLHPTHAPFFSSPIFHGCVNEHLADRTPSPTFSTSDSEITELADERQSEMEDFMDDEAFVDDTSSDAGTEEGSDIFSDGQDPFYDRSPWFILVGRLVVTTARGKSDK